MIENKRLGLGGVLVAVVASVIAGVSSLPAYALWPNDANLAPCTSVPGNLVVNCSFEAAVQGDVVPGWTHLVSHNSGVSTSIPHSGSHSLYFASVGSDDVWTQTVPVVPHTEYLVGAQFHASTTTPDDDIVLTVTNVNGSPGGGTVIFSSENANLPWIRGAQIVTTGSSRTMTLTFSGANAPSATHVDDVFAVPQRSGCAAIANNLVATCGFEPASTTPWVHSVSHLSSRSTVSNGGAEGLSFASSGTADVWYQVLTVRPHTQYTLTYWVEYYSDTSSPDNDLMVAFSNSTSPGGSVKVTTKNVANKFWAPVTRTFTTNGGSSGVLMLSGRNSPSSTYLDDFSLTVTPHVKVAAKHRKVTTTLTGLGGQKVLLQRYVHRHWVTARSFTAPKTGFSKAWALKVAKGKYRAVAQAAPGYVSTTSSAITVH